MWPTSAGTGYGRKLLDYDFFFNLIKIKKSKSNFRFLSNRYPRITEVAKTTNINQMMNQFKRLNVKVVY